MRKLLSAIAGLLVLVATPILAFSATGPAAAAASLTKVTSFGENPSNLNMYVHVPDNVAARPALLVAVHYCGGNARAFSSNGARDYVTAADRSGFVILFPEATRSGNCFDVSSPAALTRGGKSDPTGIVSMVKHAQKTYHTDPARTYLAGMSSGAMMTNVLAAEYPDVFAAATAFSGVPATCFATNGSSLWNSTCSGGKLVKTAREWADAARAMYPGYSGRYPRMQLWHGTDDDTLRYQNLTEEIKQWTALNGLDQKPTSTDHPQPNWTRTRYGSAGAKAAVEAISISDTGHSLLRSGMLQYSLDFLGLT